MAVNASMRATCWKFRAFCRGSWSWKSLLNGEGRKAEGKNSSLCSLPLLPLRKVTLCVSVTRCSSEAALLWKSSPVTRGTAAARQAMPLASRLSTGAFSCCSRPTVIENYRKSFLKNSGGNLPMPPVSPLPFTLATGHLPGLHFTPLSWGHPVTAWGAGWDRQMWCIWLLLRLLCISWV